MKKLDYDKLVDGLAKMAGVPREAAETAFLDFAPPGRERTIKALADYAGVDRKTADDALGPLRKEAANPEEEHVRAVARYAGTDVETARRFVAELREAGAKPKPEPKVKPKAALSGRLPRPPEANVGYYTELQEDSGCIVTKGDK